jgi:ABC-type nitrate/sulfonate/bicarbonate transport system substrate-binding protein
MVQARGKRLLATLLAAGLLVAACGDGGTATPAPATPAAESPGNGGGEPSPATGELPEPELTRVRIGLSVTETSQFAAKLAEMAGIYEKNGLQAEVTVFEGDGKVTQALQAGQLDVGFGGISSAITSQLTDAPIVVLAVNAQVLSDLLVSTADVTDAEGLRGKCVAVSTYGGTSHGAVILSLRALGMEPNDVVITEVGGQSARIASLQGGSCAAAPVDDARREEMEGLGFNFLVDLKAEKLPWGRSGMEVTEEWLEQNRNTAIVVAASVLEAQNMMWEQPDEAAQYYAEFIQEPDVANARALIDDFQTIGNRDMIWSEEAFENPKEILGLVNPDILPVTVSDAYDRSILQELQDIGYYERLGIPIDEGQ